MVHVDTLIAIVLILIMFGIGISLSIKEVKEVFVKPKALGISLISQMMLLPIIAFALAYFSGAPSYIQVGLVILAASPGGTTAGFISYLFNGNVALSITLTTINSLLTLISIPIIVNLALRVFIDQSIELQLPFIPTMKEIFIVTIIPAFSGIMVRYWKEDFALALAKFTKPISIVLLAIVFTLKFIGGGGEEGMQVKEIFVIIPYALALNLICFSVGLIVAKSFRLGLKNEITIAIESAVHNTSITFLVTNVLLKQPEFSKVSLVYAMFSFWTAVLFTYLHIKQKRKPIN